LSTVDVDSATVTPRADLPAGVYATELAAAGGSTYASLIRCRPGGGATSTIVRLDAGGGLHTIARGSYSDLLSGGNHPWGVIYHDDGTTSLDPLDGGAQVPVSAAFDPVAGYGNDIVGAATVLSHSSSEGPQQVQVIEPRSGKVVKVLGEALSMAVSRGVVLWTGATCPQDQCPLLAYDLAAGRRVPVTASLPKDSGLWAAVLSPDRRSLVYVRQQSGPSHYDMGHPGNPNEIAVVDLATGRTVAVPDVELWSKSSPGLAYSTDSHWLVMSFDAGSSVRLLLWEPGLEHALEPSVTVAGKVAFPPGLAALG
ncbi:MAG: hypothetical protein ACRDZY_19660, partial [Acidimicrobiales bacterium]